MKTFLILIFYSDRTRPEQVTVPGHTFADAMMRFWCSGVDDRKIIKVEIYP